MGNCFKKGSTGKITSGNSNTSTRDPDLRAVFKQFDIDGDGYIQESELRDVMRQLGHCPSDDEINAMFKAADLNKDGKISYEEFVEISRANPLALSLKTVFGELDVDGDGHITRPEMKQAFARMGHQITDKELATIFQQADTDNDGKINFDEFAGMMCQRKG